MIGAIKRRWKSNKKCSDKDKEKVTPLLTSGPTTITTSIGPSSKLRKGPPLPPVDFIHVNSGRIELHPGAEKEQLLWGQHLHYDTRHSWCGGPQQMGVQEKQQQGTKKGVLNNTNNININAKNHLSDHQQQETVILQRLRDLEKCNKGVPNLEPVVSALKEELAASVGRQERLVNDLETLHARINTLETNNKALANIILPTLIRLTKEKSSSSNTVSSNSLKKLAVATSPVKIAIPVSSQTSTSSTTSTSSESNISKMKQTFIPPTVTSTSSKATPKQIPTKAKPGSLDLKKPLPPTTSTAVAKPAPSSTECRIPFFRPNPTNSTTHPPKATISKSKAQSKPKSKLPVRKSSSSSGPSTTSPVSNCFLPSSKTKKLSSPLIIENKMRFNIPPAAIGSIDPKRPLVTVSASSSGLPPKDEGYSTMSNGAIDSQQEPPSSASTATFTRPKKLGESSSGTTTTGTWTKSKNKSPSTSPSGRTFATATVQQPASITMTQDNVRIVRGLPTDIRFSSESSDDFSGGTVLLEDSDDSDILFLPIEVSSSGSESTLVPYPYSRSSYTANSDSTSTYYTAVGGTTTDSSTDTTLSTPRRKKNGSGNNNQSSTTAAWDASGLEVDEQDLVQRWMRLEDMRNEEEAGDDQLQLWSWDWDGIIRSNANNRKDLKKIQMMSSSETLDVLLPNHRLSKDSESWDNKPPHPQGTGTKSSLDSNTWTKSKRKSYLESPGIKGSNLSCLPQGPPSPSPSSDAAVPPLLTSELDFTAEFYRLTSSGTEDKLIQTETTSSSSTENISGGPHDSLEESDLFLQCKNCLEKMSKLISLQQQQDRPSGGSTPAPHALRGDEEEESGSRMSISEQVAQLLKMNNSQRHKEGSASKWLPVPRSSFRSSTHGDRNYTLVSSTESEGLVSPSME